MIPASERTTYSKETRTQAIRLAASVGVYEAARRMSIPPGTVGSWLSRARVTAADVVPVDHKAIRESVGAVSWPDVAESTGNQAGKVARMAFIAAEELGAAGRWREAKEAALTGAIATDKAQLLTGGATSRHEGRQLVATVNADRLASMMASLSAGKGLGIPRELASDQGERALGVPSEGAKDGRTPSD